MSRGRLAVGRRLACALGLAVLSGCGGTDVRPVVNDPLLGPGAGTPVSRNIPTGPGSAPSSGVSVTGTTGRAAAANDWQELPAPTRPRVTAADLAAGADQTLEPAPALRIGTGPTPKPVEVVPTGAVGTMLQAPVPANDPRAPTSTGPASRGPGDTLQQWLDVFKQNGVTTHGPDRTANGDYQFLCLVPDRQDPKKFYRYEATAPGDPVNAVRAVRDQMQRDGR